MNEALKRKAAMKIRKLINHSFIWPVMSLSLVPIICSVSCSHHDDANIQFVELYTETNTIRPGETLQIRAIEQPICRRTNNLIWEIVDNIENVTISNKGLLSASISLLIDKPQQITVKATYPKDHSIFVSKQIWVLPSPTYTFQGFVNNEVQYLGRDHNDIRSVQLKKNDDFTYELTENIDLFYGDDDPLPSPFTSLINFEPYIGGTSQRYMSFQLESGPSFQQGIMWDDYDDGAWVDTIPSFSVINSSVLYQNVYVYFACDPRVSLILHFNLWQNKYDDVDPGKFFNINENPEDKHHIIYDEEGIYDGNILCPSDVRVGVQEGLIASIYCTRPNGEYTDFDFIINKDPEIDPDLDNALSYEIINMQLLSRPFDHQRFYKFDLFYSLDLTKIHKTAKEYDYEALPLFQIEAKDPFWPETRYACICTFQIEWI